MARKFSPCSQSVNMGKIPEKPHLKPHPLPCGHTMSNPSSSTERRVGRPSLRRIGRLGKRFRLKFYCLLILPKNLFSRFCGNIAERHLPPLVLHPLIELFTWFFQVDMSEAVEPVWAYSTFNAFFTRRLKPGSRPVDSKPETIISPVDGIVGQFGTIKGGHLIQAKGIDYTIADLLDDPSRAREYMEGQYITIYLAPYHCHRIHSPVFGSVRYCIHIPGLLWTVSSIGVNGVRNLFARNERIVSYLETQKGECAVVKIGANVVGKIKLVYHSMITNEFRAKRTEVALNPPYLIGKGDELGVFELGSTVICCFKPGQIQWNALAIGQPMRMGDVIGKFLRS